jgi:hypothetical protein
MLLSDKLNAIIRVLLITYFDEKKALTVSQLAEEVKVTYAMAKRLALRLERTEYINIRGSSITIVNPIKLLKAWSYTYSIREFERVEFVLAERPQYAILKISNWARVENTPYAFTLFSATEQVSPYVAPSNTYLYILKKDLAQWESFFKEERMLPAEKEGNLVCLLVDEDYFKGVFNIHGVNIVSLPQLYADLIAFGGRGEEAAEQILNMIKGRTKNV